MPTVIIDKNTIVSKFVAELRDVSIQTDRMRFRQNVERIGQIFAYEISKTFSYVEKEVETPLGIAKVSLPNERIVIASIIRAGLPLQQGLLSYFEDADNAFVSAYRRHHKDGTFEINLEYVTCPDLSDCVLILADPMLATGSSFAATLDVLNRYGTPKVIHLVTIIASSYGISYLKRTHPRCKIWTGAVDEELTAKSYIVPGLGDAGDLLFGAKLQD
ncbi:MAG: uracil phosphoribosyltransferase [Saprospiraceae bacterium]|nr:uracil phosphoribosyltransferase [Saprospiraceae bacterium]